jgi:hypothetical protein
MIAFEKLVETLVQLKRENKSFSTACSWCAVQGMNLVDYAYDWETYQKEGYGTVVITKNSKVEIKGIRAWKWGSHEYIINTIPFK